jgi:tetratricopeptide (TPR) repeat protein
MQALLSFILLLSAGFTFSQINTRGAEAENTTTGKSGKTHVVLIGVSSYKNLPEEQQLDFADDDALFFKEYLRSQGVSTAKVFLNEQAFGKDLIGREIQQTLVNEAQPGDEVIIFFAGHGDVDSLAGDGFLLLNGVDPPSVASYDFSDALSLNTLRKMINYAVDKKNINVTFIADACHSGTMRSGNANKMISEINNNMVTITSCQPNELSKESIEFGNGHGVFTYFLIQGLMGLADEEVMGDKNGSIDLNELEMYVKTKVALNTQKKQNPVFSMSGNKEFVQVDPRLLEIARKSKNGEFKELAALTKDKSVTVPEEGIDGPCGAYLKLFQEQTIDHKFFADELDSLDKLPVATGTSKSKKEHTKKVNCIAVSPDGMWTATGSLDGIALNLGRDLEKPKWLKGQSGEIVSVDFSPEKGLLASASMAGTVIVWNPATGAILHSLIKLSSAPTVVRFLAENKLAIGTAKGSVVVWELTDNKQKEIKLHKGSVKDIELLGDQLVTAGADGKILKADLASGKKSAQFETALSVPFTTLQLVPNSSRMLSGSEDGVIRIWDPKSGKLLKEVKTEVGIVNGFSLDPFEKFVFYSGSKQKKTGILDLENQTLLKSKLLTTGSATGLYYDPVLNLLKVAEYDGSVSYQVVKVNPDIAAATDLHEKLLDCDGLKDIKYKIDGTLIIGLNNEVNKVLDNLINGKEDVTLNEVKGVLRYAGKAYEIGKEYEFDAEKLEINLLLLEMYEILISSKTEKYPEALKKVKRLEELDPKGAYVQNVAAQLYLRMKDLSKAKEAALRAEQLAPKWSETSVNTGKVLLAAGDKKGAEVHFKDAIKETPEMTKGYVSLGGLYLEQGKHQEALELLTEARKLDPESAAIRNLYGETYVKASNAAKKSNGKKPGTSTREKYASKWPLIENHTFYIGFANILQFTDPSVVSDLKFTTSSGTLGVKSGKYIMNVGNVKSVTINVLDAFTGDTVGTQDFFVRSLPTPVFQWGNSKDGGFIDFSARDFFYGYLNEPDLIDAGPQILGYEAVFLEEEESVNDEFNPNGQFLGGFVVEGDGSRINPAIYNEVKKRQWMGTVGKVCVQIAVLYPSGVKEVKSACFNY